MKFNSIRYLKISRVDGRVFYYWIFKQNKNGNKGVLWKVEKKILLMFIWNITFVLSVQMRNQCLNIEKRWTSDRMAFLFFFSFLIQIISQSWRKTMTTTTTTNPFGIFYKRPDRENKISMMRGDIWVFRAISNGLKSTQKEVDRIEKKTDSFTFDFRD